VNCMLPMRWSCTLSRFSASDTLLNSSKSTAMTTCVQPHRHYGNGGRLPLQGQALWQQAPALLLPRSMRAPLCSPALNSGGRRHVLRPKP
jgi:hypothetical protein